MSAWAGLLAFLQALPKLIDLAIRIGIWMTDKKVLEWLDDLQKVMDQLDRADTAEKKRIVARDLSRLLRRLR